METNTDLQPKKSSSPRKFSKNEELKISKLITENKWWPFERVNPKILEKLHKKTINHEEALL